MDEYLVMSHLGGYYISSSEPEFIEAYCETCGDRDQIVASWDSEVKNAKVNALSDYFAYESIKSKENLEELITYENEISKVDIIEDIIDYTISNSYSNEENIKYLYEDGNLSDLEFKELLKRNKEDLKNQLIIIRDKLRFYITDESAIKMVNKTYNPGRNLRKSLRDYIILRPPI